MRGVLLALPTVAAHAERILLPGNHSRQRGLRAGAEVVALQEAD
jgi:hypothetical protein